MSTRDNRPAMPTENEADALEQQAPAAPDPQEDELEDDAGINDPVRPHGDPLRPEGSEADRWEQNTDGGVLPEEDEYPREDADDELH